MRDRLSRLRAVRLPALRTRLISPSSAIVTHARHVSLSGVGPIKPDGIPFGIYPA